MKKRTWTDQQLIDAVKNSRSKLEVLKELGLPSPGGYRTLNKYIRRLNLSLSHFETKSERQKRYGKPARIPDDAIFVEDSEYDSCSLKRRIARDNLILYRCQKCGLGDTWDGLPLTLQLDHINGKNRDNRLENLRYLCPNCHSQTDTFCRRKVPLIPKQKTPCLECKDVLVRSFTVTGLCRSCAARHRLEEVNRCIGCNVLIAKTSTQCRKCSNPIRKTKITWPSVEELEVMLTIAPRTAVASKLGVSDNAIKKHLKRYKRKAPEL